MLSRLHLPENTIQVWIVRTDLAPAVVAQLEALLDAEEKSRAARFHFERDRQPFVITRAWLRCLIGRYANLEPDSLRFTYGPQGKPSLALDAQLDFNISHSGRFALLGFTRKCRIGVDVERVRPLPGWQDIARSFFGAEEVADLMSVPLVERERAFFSCWTRKEAYIKAVGTGLSLPLESFRVTLALSEPARLLYAAIDGPASAWTLHDLAIAPDYAASLAYRDQPRHVVLMSSEDPPVASRTELHQADVGYGTYRNSPCDAGQHERRPYRSLSSRSPIGA